MYQSEDGLCWWRADEKQGAVEKPKARQKNSKPSSERGEQGVEFYTAAVEAHACGAQVLLGDRDFKVCHLLYALARKSGIILGDKLTTSSFEWKTFSC